jgi:hypothetical protein
VLLLAAFGLGFEFMVNASTRRFFTVVPAWPSR